MKKNIKNKINFYNKINVNKRLNIIKIITLIFFAVILVRLFYLNILMHDYYKLQLNSITSNIVYGNSAPRGRIYDRNNKLLVDNISVKKIYYLKSKNINSKEEINLAYKVSKHLNLTYDKLLLRNLKEFFLVIYPEEGNNKITNDEYKLLENRKLTNNDIYELKIDRINDNDLKIFTDDDKKAAYLYYLMNKGYSNEEKTIKVKDVSNEEYSYISENLSDLSGFNTKLDWERVYLYGDTLRSILGNVSTEETGIPYEMKNYYLSKGYSLNDRVGLSGIEKQYEDILKGTKDKYRVLDNGSLDLISLGKKGNDIVLSLDIDLQKEIDNIISEEIINAKKEANTNFYNRSFVIIQNPKTGEVLSISGKQVLKNSNKTYDIYDYSIGTITSTITPGSVVKGASMSVGYDTGVISIGTVMQDRCIKLLNMPEKCSWKTLGMINDLQALQYSSNVYQYKIAMMVGKFNYRYNSMLKIDLNAFDTYRNMFYQYGLGVKTGIDFPVEEDGFKGGSYAGDLLINFAIGQYDTYTPLQLSQYISTIANHGNRVKPRFLKYILDDNGKIIYEEKTIVLNKVKIEDKFIDRIQEGFKLVMKSGTGVNYMGSLVNPAGKTGTSESFVDDNNDNIYDHATMSNNFIGYAPYDNPTMSIEVSSPDIQDVKKGTYKSNVNYRIARRSSNAFYKYYDEKGNRR